MTRSQRSNLIQWALFVAGLALVALVLGVTVRWGDLADRFFKWEDFTDQFPGIVTEAARNTLVYTAIGYGGSFIPFTFLAPLLQQQAGFSAGAVGWVMLAYGVSVAVGNLWGGRLADRRGPIPALKVIFLALAAVLLVFTFTSHQPVLAVLTVLVWGAFAFGNVPGLQVYVVQQAERVSPQAVDVASGLNIAAFNLGIAFAAWAGGLIVTHVGLQHTPWMGAVVVLVSLALTHWSGALDRAAPGPRSLAAR